VRRKNYSQRTADWIPAKTAALVNYLRPKTLRRSSLPFPLIEHRAEYVSLNFSINFQSLENDEYERGWQTLQATLR